MSKPKRFYRFDSIAEMLEANVQEPLHPANNWLEENSGSYSGGMCSDRPRLQTPRDARRAFSEPMFPQGVERIERLINSIETPQAISVRRVPRRHSEGDELDMQRVWQGDLDHAWRDMHRASRVGPARILIATNALIPASVHSEQFAWRGVAALALAQAFKEAGHTVRVSTGISMVGVRDSEGSGYSCECVVMDCGDAMDIHKAASLMASGLLARGLLYNHIVKTSKSPVSRGIGPGNQELTASVLDAAGFDHVAIADGAIYNAASAKAWIAEHIAVIDARSRGEELAA